MSSTNSATTPKADTIVALSTPPGRGAIAIIRLSGPEALSTADQLWRGIRPVEHLEPRKLYNGWVIVAGKRLDKSVITTSQAPRSYTGEDMVEIHTHGSPAVVSSVIRVCIERGARLAEPGEFTKRALLNGKLDVAQAEAVADLVEAQSDQLVRLAADQLAGGLSTKMKELTGRIVTLSAAEAAYLDFSEEDIEDQPKDNLVSELNGISKSLQELLDQSHNVPVLREGLKVALVGLPNAGKSTLLNTLVGYERSIVTDVAGTTRDTIEEHAMIKGLPVRLIDTAGLNTDPDHVEAIGIQRTHDTVLSADLVLVLAAPNTLADTLDYMKQNSLLDAVQTKPTILVKTKADQNNSVQEAEWAHQSVVVSAVTGQGVGQLKQAIYSQADVCIPSEGAALTTQRQFDIVTQSLQHINTAIQALGSGVPRDVVLVELEAAAKALNKITGTDTNEAMLDDMFSHFCIGK